MKMSEIPLHELFKDKYESMMDIEVCRWALLIAQNEINRDETIERIRLNMSIVLKIDNELINRIQQALEERR